MKVVLFCGGLGVRMGAATQRIPKPMIPVGNQPIVHHIMEYYASWGHKQFVLCVGYKADSVKRYFSKDTMLQKSAVADWTITFDDQGTKATTGERLMAATAHLGDDDYLLATYGDGLTDAPLDLMIDRLISSGKTGLFLSVRPTYSAHVVVSDPDGTVRQVEDIQGASVRINGGFFVFRRDVIDYIRPGEELVEEPFERLIEKEELLAVPYEGFWRPMDTLKDKQFLDALAETGQPPWSGVGASTEAA